MKEKFIDVTPGDNHMKITEVYAFISSDENGDGIYAQLINGKMLPFVFSDKKMVDKCKSLVEMTAKATGKKIKLIKFTHREEIEEIG